MRTMVTVLLLAGSAAAQQIQLNLEHLAAKAEEAVDVKLDGSTLQLASRFLSGKSADEARVKKLIEGLQGIYVKAFEFEKPGAYTQADVEAVRSQLRSPEWSRIVGVRSRKDGENAEVFLHGAADRVTGLVILATEPTEFTVVNIVGPIDLEALSELGGQFSIPAVQLDRSKDGKKGK